MENSVTKREKISYGLYFMGQNVFYGLIGYMTTYFTDIGITAALVAIVALITKARACQPCEESQPRHYFIYIFHW